MLLLFVLALGVSCCRLSPRDLPYALLPYGPPSLVSQHAAVDRSNRSRRRASHAAGHRRVSCATLLPNGLPPRAFPPRLTSKHAADISFVAVDASPQGQVILWLSYAVRCAAACPLSFERSLVSLSLI